MADPKELAACEIALVFKALHGLAMTHLATDHL